jgi:hypothetical protein
MPDENQGADLETVHAIAQDHDGRDRGPTCLAFHRYGGALAEGPPMEGSEAVTPDKAQTLADKIREHLASKYEATQSDASLWANAVSAGLSEFAPVKDSVIFDGRYSKDWIEVLDRPVQEVLGDIIRLMNNYLALDPRGVIVPMYASRDKIHDIFNNPERRKNKEPHWVAYLGQEGEQARVYDPSDSDNVDQHRLMDINALAYAHLWYCVELEQSEARPEFMGAAQGDPATGFTSVLVYGAEADENRYIKKNDNIGQIDLKNWFDTTAAQELIAQDDAVYHFSCRAADEAAELISVERSVIVLECPAGLFAVVPVNDVGSSSADGDSGVDQGTQGDGVASFLVTNWEKMGSLNLLLAYADEETGERKIKKKKLNFSESHREEES